MDELEKCKIGKDLTLLYKKGDRVIGERIALGKYEEFETELFLERLDPEMVVVDVGANIGYYTLLAAKRVKKVIAIEPDKGCFEILKKNIEENGLKNVVLVNKAASSKKEIKKLIKDDENMGNSHFGEGKGEKVLCERLDEILENEQKIGLIKIDTQGWEPEVVKGGEKIIKRDSPEMFLEYSPADYKRNKLDEREMVKTLREVYQGIFEIDHWYYIYKRVRRDIGINKRKGYSDLWLKKKVEIKDYLRAYKNLQIKKVIKAIMGYE